MFFDPVTGRLIFAEKGNATVPPSVPMRPPQAFVDNALLFTDLATQLAPRGLRYIDSDFIQGWLTNAAPAPGVEMNSGGNAGNVLTQENTDDLFAMFAAAWTDLSGGIGPVRMAAPGIPHPTPEVAHVDQITTVDFAGGAHAAGIKTITFAEGVINITLDDALDFAASSGSTIGIQDNPSDEDMAARFEAFYGSFCNFGSHVLAGTVITITDSHEANFGTGSGYEDAAETGITVQIGQLGTPEQLNVNLQFLIDSGVPVSYTGPDGDAVSAN